VSTIDAVSRETPAVPGAPPRLLVVQAPYYEQVVTGMRRGAERVFAEAGASAEVVDVAGAFELPAALRMALLSQAGSRFDGYLVLGCVVRGETDHYDHICRETCRGVMDISTDTGAAIGFGLLTVDTLPQAVARSGEDRMNKGAEAAQALLGQVALRRRWNLG
jgi:6,7-dimethyl-8-ribityllumazine synthase